MALWQTNVGSHMWGMNRPDSDIDIFEAYQAQSKDILMGTANTKSYNQIGGNDIAGHEIGKVVDMLIAGNMNFVLGVMSPIIIQNSAELQTLRNIYYLTASKNLYHSAHGLALHNYKKYFEKEKDLSWKKMAQVLRVINFAETFLIERKLEFKPIPKEQTIHPDYIYDKILELKSAYSKSELREHPDEKPYREWLYRLRLKELQRGDTPQSQAEAVTGTLDVANPTGNITRGFQATSVAQIADATSESPIIVINRAKPQQKYK